MNLENSEKYKGQIKNGQFNGKGKYMYKNGNFYEGEWKNGKQNGVGIFKNKGNFIY